MKYLRIKDKKAEYYDGKDYKLINEIGKKDLLYLLNSAEQDDFEIDPYNEESLTDPAHRIIYKNISEKLDDFLGNKDNFKVQVEKTYHEAMSKYSAQISGDDDAGLNFGDSANGAEEDTGEINPDDIPF